MKKLRYYKIGHRRYNSFKTFKKMDNSQYDMRKFGFKIKRMNNELHKRRGHKVTDKIGYEILHRKLLC